MRFLNQQSVFRFEKKYYGHSTTTLPVAISSKFDSLRSTPSIHFITFGVFRIWIVFQLTIAPQTPSFLQKLLVYIVIWSLTRFFVSLVGTVIAHQGPFPPPSLKFWLVKASQTTHCYPDLPCQFKQPSGETIPSSHVTFSSCPDRRKSPTSAAWMDGVSSQFVTSTDCCEISIERVTVPYRE